jgi:ubiquinol-cytochrome c reductase cytochrome b subunit
MPSLSFIKRIEPWTRLSQLTYKIPEHGNRFFYSLGGMVAVGFLIMIATGLLLAQVYNPAPDLAYQSLQAIQQMSGASYLRALHYWMAQGVIVALLLHLARVFITGAYQHPRQVTWWIGVALLATLLMGSYFTGTVLKWDEEGLDALAHYKETLLHLGPIGAALTDALPGSPPMNFRVYVSHIALFPLLLIFLLVIHIYLIHTFNLSPTPKDRWADQPEIPESEMKGRFDQHMAHILVFSMLYYGWLSVLAFFVPAPLGGPPVPEHAALKPPWPFLWMYDFENLWGVVAVLFASAILFGLLALVPLIDRKQDRRFSARKPILTAGALLGATLIGLTLHGYIIPAQSHLSHSHGADTHKEEPSHHNQSDAHIENNSDHHSHEEGVTSHAEQ